MKYCFFYIRKTAKVAACITEGACIGYVGGVAAAVLTGTVALITVPAWMPMVGGATLITPAAMAAASSWATIGAVVGGVVKGATAIGEGGWRLTPSA